MAHSKRIEDFNIDELLHEVKLRENKEKLVHNIGEREIESLVVPNESENEALGVFTTSEIIEGLKEKQKAIYGVDDRMDVKDVVDQEICNAADSVVALFEATSVSDNGDGTSTLKTKKFGTAYRLCSTEKFRNQPIGAFCSGFLVAPDIIATAGHCIIENNVTDIRFVFGFRMIDDSKARTVISNSEIYQGAELIGIGHEDGESEADWALVRLNRSVTNHKPLKIRRTEKIADNESVYVIGHPVGLPTKYADGENVRENGHNTYFVANLDTYGGNSGSPIFNSDHIVEGILVRGATDFVMNGNCSVSLICSASNCVGEVCTRTTVFANSVPIIND
ncbi:serine protease [Bacillus cereus]|uniref:trypsin-like serine peptidase n=1 Tax=Bacillus cereus TaxID=1396 RepID=UPI002404E1BB|nr:serine protease [Bacillus cereus]MDF9505845.1 serine protease [Bacillus cereus]MDF9596428.1 serine protease [Bacillus cereus]MDF9608028.1 serine protease [Bacillus cereus]MDF9659241.1 serine protease [Bacillus cereus]